MFTGRFFWRLFSLNLLVALSVLVAVTVLAGQMMKRGYLASVEQDLTVRATLLAPFARDAFLAPDPRPFEALLKTMGAETGTRFTLILPSGRVIGDSAEEPAEMSNHSDRPEVRAAFGGRASASTRFSSTVERTLTYVAVPVRQDGRILGVARAAVPVDAIEETLVVFYRRMAYGGLGIALLSAALSFAIARRSSRPLEQMRDRANELLSGISEAPIPIPDTTELGGLADAVNRMAFELDQRLKATLRNNRELEAILSTMVDGVLVTDRRGVVLRANEAARRMLGVGDEVLDRPLRDAAPNRALEELIERILSSSAGASAVDAELPLGGGTIEARGLPLLDTFERTTGALVVLTDKTRVRQLETLRRDFAAHVSHELKTPLTAVRGFADTLLSGALDEPAQARRFVGFIAEQSLRLERLVDGLMELAKIERRAERRDLEKSWHHVRPILESVVLALEERTKERDASISIDCPPDLASRLNAPLLERAVFNLVDNALRYNSAGVEVRIRARDGKDALVITVQDSGDGIPPGELDRLFERFYRVPGSRTQNPEGIGLGLAIVKHIVLAHGGAVHVASAPKEGTTFELSLAKY